MITVDINGRKHQITGRLEKVLRHQPGYRPRNAMSLQRTVTGGVRLYALVGGRWMDASLDDISPKDIGSVVVP